MGKNDLGVVVLGLGLVYFLSRKKNGWESQNILEDFRLTDPSYQINGNGSEDDKPNEENEEKTQVTRITKHKPIPIVTKRIPIVSHIAEKPVKRIRGVYEIR